MCSVWTLSFRPRALESLLLIGLVPESAPVDRSHPSTLVLVVVDDAVEDDVVTVAVLIGIVRVEVQEQAFLKLDRSNPDHAKLLDLHRATRYVAVDSEDIFQPIEEAGRQGGLIK